MLLSVRPKCKVYPCSPRYALNSGGSCPFWWWYFDRWTSNPYAEPQPENVRKRSLSFWIARCMEPWFYEHGRQSYQRNGYSAVSCGLPDYHAPARKAYDLIPEWPCGRHYIAPRSPRCLKYGIPKIPPNKHRWPRKPEWYEPPAYRPCHSLYSTNWFSYHHHTTRSHASREARFYSCGCNAGELSAPRERHRTITVRCQDGSGIAGGSECSGAASNLSHLQSGWIPRIFEHLYKRERCSALTL